MKKGSKASDLDSPLLKPKRLKNRRKNKWQMASEND